MRRGSPILLLSASVALLAYSTVRAHTLSFTWDEAWTFMHHVLRGEFYPERYDVMGANHHLLNVWTMWASMKLFGESELALRLPSLLAHVLYLYATARIALRARSMLIAVCVFVLLNAHPYLLDFFSLARGYGLSIACMMMALWHLLCWHERMLQRDAVLVALFAGLSVLAQLIMINFLFSVCACMALVLWRRGVPRPAVVLWKHVRWPLAIVVLALVIALPHAWRVRDGGGLIWGCEDFWKCTVGTLLESLMYTTPPVLGRWLTVRYFVLAGLLLFGVCALPVFTRREALRQGPLRMVALCLVLCLLAIALQHFLLGVEWPRSRTALYWIPLLALCCGLLLQGARTDHWYAPLLGGAVSGLLLVHTVVQANINHTNGWPESCDVRRMVSIIVADHAAHGCNDAITSVVSSNVSWGSLGYYARVMKARELVYQKRAKHDPFPLGDYYIVERGGAEVDTTHMELLFRSSVIGTALYRDRRFVRTGSKPIVLGRAMIGPGSVQRHVCALPDSAPGVPWQVIGSVMVPGHDSRALLNLQLERIHGDHTLEKVKTGQGPFDQHVQRPLVELSLPEGWVAGDSLVLTVLPEERTSGSRPADVSLELYQGVADRR